MGRMVAKQISKTRSQKKGEAQEDKEKSRAEKEDVHAPSGTFEAVQIYLPKKESLLKNPKEGSATLPQRTVTNALHAMSKTGCPWQALPKEKVAPWQSIYSSSRRWRCKNVFQKIFKITSEMADQSKNMRGGSVIRAQQHVAT